MNESKRLEIKHPDEAWGRHHKSMRAATSRITLPFCIVVLLSLAVVFPLSADDWRHLVQPLGTLVVVESAATVNSRLGGYPPFETSTEVTTIQTSTPQYFVRFYNPEAAENPSNAVGSWVMRSAEVRGRSPAEVRNIFALPTQPTMMTMVLVPTDAMMYTGIAAPIEGWGEGGGQQSKLIGPPWVPTENFINQQKVGDCILCYRNMAKTGNPYRVAAYLDGRLPAPYSDLEEVFLNLDLLYFEPTSAQLSAALEQISPHRYDHLTTEAEQANFLSNDMIEQRILALTRDISPRETPVTNDSRFQGAWIQLAGSSHRAGDLGFNSRLNAIGAGLDRWVTPDILLGFSTAFISSHLDWTDDLGSAQNDYVRVGVYGAKLHGNWLLQAGFHAGFSDGEAKRDITFLAANRGSRADIGGWSGHGSLLVGYRLVAGGMTLMPLGGLDYLYHGRDAITEKGAESLNLRVRSAANHTIRSRVGMILSGDINLASGMVLTPQFQIGWANICPLDDRAINAKLEGQPDSFTVYGDNKALNSLMAKVGANLTAGKRFSFFTEYALDYRHNVKNHTLAAGISCQF